MSELTYVRVCATTDIAKDAARAVTVDGTDIALVHAQTEDGTDAYFAIRDECSHAAVALSEGEIDGCTLECWLHGSRFDLRTGQPTGLPATQPVPIYPVKHDGEDILVGLEES